MFSMLQMMIALSCASRNTSYSISAQPATLRSSSTEPTGLTFSPSLTSVSSSSILAACPDPVPPRQKAARPTRGKPLRSAKSTAAHRSATDALGQAQAGRGPP